MESAKLRISLVFLAHFAHFEEIGRILHVQIAQNAEAYDTMYLVSGQIQGNISTIPSAKREIIPMN